jgi:hypothetical protein
MATPIKVSAKKAKELMNLSDTELVASAEFKKYFNLNNTAKATDLLYASDETRQSLETKTATKFKKFLKTVVKDAE